MPNGPKSLIRRALEAAIRKAFTRAYKTIQVDPEKYMAHLRAAYGLPAISYDGVFGVELHMLDHIAEETIRSSMKIAAAEGAGLGMGGLFTVIPDLGFLAAITMRMIQKLSLIYGFPYTTEEEQAELWVAAASAAGVDITRDLVEKQVISKFVPRVISAIATQASKEIVEKWAGRLIPVVSGLIGAGLNYYFARVWGARALGHFRERHLALRRQQERAAAIPLPASSAS
jgi:hypothetical protein